MASGGTASRLSVYSTAAGQAWLIASARAAGFDSIGQWADFMALKTDFSSIMEITGIKDSELNFQNDPSCRGKSPPPEKKIS